MDKTCSCSRRFFLTLVGAGALANSVGCSAPAGTSPAPVGDLPAGNVNDLPVGSLRAVGREPAAIGHDADGIYAMTLTCTHQGCNMAIHGSVDQSGVFCSCHGSRFTANGDVQTGPAPDPLAHFQVDIDATGEMTIRGDIKVSENTRTPVT